MASTLNNFLRLWIQKLILWIDVFMTIFFLTFFFLFSGGQQPPNWNAPYPMYNMMPMPSGYNPCNPYMSYCPPSFQGYPAQLQYPFPGQTAQYTPQQTSFPPPNYPAGFSQQPQQWPWTIQSLSLSLSPFLLLDFFPSMFLFFWHNCLLLPLAGWIVVLLWV